MADLFWLPEVPWAVIEPFMPKDQPGPAHKDDLQIISGHPARAHLQLPLAR